MEKIFSAALAVVFGGLPAAEASAQVVVRAAASTRAPGRVVPGAAPIAPAGLFPRFSLAIPAPSRMIAVPGAVPSVPVPSAARATMASVAAPALSAAAFAAPAPAVSAPVLKLAPSVSVPSSVRAAKAVSGFLGTMRRVVSAPASLGRFFDRSVERGALSACADHDQPGAFLAEIPAARPALARPSRGAAAAAAAVPSPGASADARGWAGLARSWLAAAAAAVKSTLMKDMTIAPLALRSDPATGRLPRTARPDSYDLRVTIDPDGGRFAGSVSIAVDLDAPVKELTLHAVGLSFGKIAFDAQDLPLEVLSVDEAAETITLRLPEPAQAGRHTLVLAWTGELGRHMKGLYLSKAEHEGKPENYAFTHFEPTDARRMFPSFDEPEFKAVFRTTLSGPEKLTLLSNMPAVSESVKDGVKTVSFAETPRMSTYLLAVAAGRLVPQTRMVEGVAVTVWTRPSEAGQAGFALDAAENALKSLNAYFALPYKLPKLDLVAVPDFAAGAMENWGVIFFRDSALLIDPTLSSTRAQRRVAETVTHEIVHQWFGNLVTMRWWNDLWLNEAFATWLAYKVVDVWKPEWNTWLSFDARRQGPLAVDALAATRAIRSKAVSSADIRAMFDGLTYTKGGTILRMVESFIGEAAFTEGVRLYMRRHAYGNTEADDLWAALEKTSGKPVGRIARGWLGQPGYPLVKVASLSADNRRLRLSQQRFTADGHAEAGRWAVPVQLAYEQGGKVLTHTVLLDEETAEVTLPGDGPVAWVYPNSGETGFFRIGLDEGLLAALPAELAKGLAGVERTGLLANLWAEAQAGTGPLTRFLDTLVRFKGDDSRAMTEKTAEALVELQDGLLAPADKARFARFAADLLGPRWEAWGFKDIKDDEVRLARAAALAAYGRAAGDAALSTDITRRARAAALNPASVEATLVSPLLSLAARSGGRDLYDLYRGQLEKAATPEQRDQLLKALSTFTDPTLARETLELTLSDAVRAQDLWKPWLFLLRNPAAKRAAWDFLKARWPDVRRKAGPRGAAAIIEGLAAVHDAQIRAEAESFFADPTNAEPTAKRALAQSLEFMAAGARFESSARAAFSAWLRANYP